MTKIEPKNDQIQPKIDQNKKRNPINKWKFFFLKEEMAKKKKTARQMISIKTDGSGYNWQERGMRMTWKRTKENDTESNIEPRRESPAKVPREN